MRYYDRRGRSLSLEQWAALRARAGDGYRRVADEEVPTPGQDTVWVSTVWTGIDHNWSRHGPPSIFETRVLRPGMATELCDRYPSEQGARDGHALIVQAIKDGLLRLGAGRDR